ncbi:MAG: phage baseplate assembly protein V [Rhodocyclaceae bacterium]|nr:MAG: phage baseplate assembly protein V [Rhodocyclaceae bacterium]
MIDQIHRAIDSRLRGIRLAFRGVITLVKAAGSVQLVQVDALAGEQLQDAELMQHYGYTSNPPQGTMAIVLPIGGKTAHGIIIATEHGSYRLKNLASGEVAIYDDQGQKVHLTRAGIIIDGAGLPIKVQNTPLVTVDAPQTHFTGKVTVDDLLTYSNGLAGTGGSNANTITGNLTHTGGSLSSNGKVLHTHTHGGVQAGGSSTAGPN